ncbi:hypothetical protein L226DRAFT_569748 [Lentinus tigrinus ALCF2SS1-7]|uniref:Uncharacterized protein n=1 Tax=Lentinus tigrinus ALCF2SS1-6 TaxID=1328759 RepID=A0A5C2SKF4_9APHY|nr:hypothetical protein L227DRAFT_607971 [Lentinus tigrinus ALCF2SS1-6]RPD76493.1 hypothetical protein L226DRAFT_569748 [Lentinus tigrinus ALCF2SS1-7]
MTFSSWLPDGVKYIADDDIHPNLAKVIHPFNVLRLLLRTKEVGGYDFEKVKPELICLSNMIEVQFTVHVIKVGRQDYIFLPKLRAICLFGKQVVIVPAHVTSPLKVKRKVGYGREDSEDDAHGPAEPPKKAMRRPTLREGASRDVSMASDSK